VSIVLLAADLDRTLIYSRSALALGDESPEPELVCVEEHEGKHASFMTASAAKGLANLPADAMLMPVTTRIPDQYRRVRLPGPAAKYASVANGGVLLVDGHRDPDWSRQVAARLADAMPLAEVWEHIAQVCRPEWTVKIRNGAGLFCYAVLHRSKVPAGFVSEVTAWADERGWGTSMQGRKLYWVPYTLTKSSAVAEVARRVGAELVLAAGDSLLDIDLLEHADRGIHPAHGELFDTGWSAPNVIQTSRSGVLAGEEITDWFCSNAAT
jgi:hypothetical protein